MKRNSQNNMVILRCLYVLLTVSALALPAPTGPQLPGGTMSLNQGWRFYRVDNPRPAGGF
jgi:hypothetical protein